MKTKSRIISVLVLMALASASFAFTPWGAVYESARDERSIGQQAKDKAVVVSIKGKMADRDGKMALKVKTYCFVGRVFLVGAIDDKGFRDFAVKTAKGTENVRSVKTHFVKETDTTKADLEIAARVRTALIAEKDLSATQIENEVMNGEVVMLGMVRSKKDASLAVKTARAIDGVRKVTSYLIPSE